MVVYALAASASTAIQRISTARRYERGWVARLHGAFSEPSIEALMSPMKPRLLNYNTKN
jgi:hypothetical protein